MRIQPTTPYGILAVSLAIGCTHFASTRPQDVDLGSFTAVHIAPEAPSLAPLFPHYRQIVKDGFYVRTGRRASDRMREWISHEYQGIRADGTSWTVLVNIYRFESVDAAAVQFERDCLGPGTLIRDPRFVTQSGASPSVECVSVIAQLRNDPEGLYLPSRTYVSYVTIQRSDTVATFYEHRVGDIEIVKQPIIDSVGQTLSATGSSSNPGARCLTSGCS